MNLFRTIILTLALLLSGMLYGQFTVTIDPIGQVPVGGTFTVSPSVTLDQNSTPVTPGPVVLIEIKVFDPSGNLVLAPNPTEEKRGFTEGQTRDDYSVTSVMPWSEDDKWNPNALWSAVVTVTSSVTNPAIQTETFPLLIADLTLEVNAPITAAPGDFVDLSGFVRNLAAVQTEPGVYFKVEAYIPNTTSRQSIVFPPAGSWTPGNTWPIQGTMDNNFIIPKFFIPFGTPDGPLQITVEVDDPVGVPLSEVIHEQDDIVNNSFTHTINIDSGTANLQPSTDFLINGGLEGSYQGLDAVRCTVSIVNVGTGPVATGNAFDYRVFLSNDLTVSNDDFLLRQVDLGATGLGNGLLPNESITLDWVQMLPDNFEGDYYVIADLNGVLLNARTTPSLTLRSENAVNLELESAGEPGARPSSSADGQMVVFEQPGPVTRIFLRNLLASTIIELTTAFNGNAPNGSSFAPRISSDGRFVVFHSFASNLIANDNNEHADIFRYDVFNQKLLRISIDTNGNEANGGSFYPVPNADGSRVAFESHAGNLVPSSTYSGKEIFAWKKSFGLSKGTIELISNGNADSFDASISGNGSRIAFTTFATDLVVGETDDNGHSDVILWENGNYYHASRSESGSLPVNGDNKQPEISLDGRAITFVSSARNMVSGKGIAHILIEDAGVRYPAGSTVLINDANGTGASVRISSLNAYGEIMAFSIDNPGRNYVNPTLTVVTPGTAPLPTRNVSAIPLLINPEGDVFRITVDAIKSGGGSERVSESAALDGDTGSETGGNLGSREPSISRDGSFIAYTTRSSNLQDLNVSSTNVKTFANHRFRPATAQAVLHWGIGSAIITNPGSGYLGRGSIDIVDLSGSGSGAVATYSVLQNGQVGSITIVNPGSGYNLSTTSLSIQSDPSGSGFACVILGDPAIGLGATRTGGATIHRIEMIDSGIGYASKLNSFLEPPEILVDGDGADLDTDGKPDARLNPDRLFTASDGRVYLEQQIDITINNLPGLIGTSLSIADANQTVVFSFASTPQPPFVLGVTSNLAGNAQTASGLRNDLITAIMNFWGTPTNILTGPLIENNATGGNSFTLRALNGSAVSNNLSSLRVSFRSNMLIGGSGYTRATPFITPAPSVIGFSEVESGTSTLLSPNGRPIFDAREDLLTDDVYYYDHNLSRNSRVSLSKFGFPTNYLATTTMPSHRHPSLSEDGRYVFFSSDATGLGGLLMGNSNQIAADTNNFREIYKRDMKNGSNPLLPLSPIVSLNLDILQDLNYTTLQGNTIPITLSAQLDHGFIRRAELYVNNRLEGQQNSVDSGSGNSDFALQWTSVNLGVNNLQVILIDNLGHRYPLEMVFVEVKSENPEVMFGELHLNPPINQGRQIFILTPAAPGGGGGGGGGGGAAIAGPFTDDNVSTLILLNDPLVDPANFAYLSTQNAATAIPLFELYPPRSAVTRGSTLNVMGEFFNVHGSRSNIKEVVFYLNGKKVFTDSSSPFAYSFTPPAMADYGEPNRNWVITAVAIPLNGSPYIVSQFGELGGQSRFPNSNLSLVAEDEIEYLFDKQRVGFQVSVNGENELLEQLRDHYFVVNGHVFDQVKGQETNSSVGEILQVDYYATLNADFTKYADSAGNIEVSVLGLMETVGRFTPVYMTNSINIKIKPPMPWIDDLSAAVGVFDDLSDHNLTTKHVEEMQFYLQDRDNGLSDWILDLSKRADFNKRMDVFAGQKITLGEFHESFFNYKLDLDMNTDSTISGDNDTWLRVYLERKLSSVDYRARFDPLPFLVGSYANSDLYDYGQNRRKYVHQILDNKYEGYSARFEHLHEGSSRILQFWDSIESQGLGFLNGYWEVHGPSPFQLNPGLGQAQGTIEPVYRYDPFVPIIRRIRQGDIKQNQDILTEPPRRDTMYGHLIYPEGIPSQVHINVTAGNAGIVTPSLLGLPRPGECAIEFAFHITRETKLNGMDYVSYTEQYRDTMFKKGALLIMLWKEKAFPMSYSKLSSMPSNFIDFIKYVTNHPNFFAKYNFIWQNSIPVNIDNPYWKNESWFGYFWDKYFPWIYHNDLGWVYIAGVSTENFWMHHQKLGWLWTGFQYYPYVYSNNEQSWIYLSPENSNYYLQGTQTWVSY